MTDLTTARLLYVEECGYRRALREYGIGGYGPSRLERLVLELEEQARSVTTEETP